MKEAARTSEMFYKTLQPRRHASSYSALWETKLSTIITVFEILNNAFVILPYQV